MDLKKYKVKDLAIKSRHYSRTQKEAEDLKLSDTSFSKINPTKTYLNYNLHSDDMMTNYDNLVSDVYLRRKDETVVFCSLVITLPKDYKRKNIELEEKEPDPKKRDELKKENEKEFFDTVYKKLIEIPEFKNCIGAYVHYDETSPHMHFLFMPIKELEKEKVITRREKVFDEKKQKEVTRKVEHKYQKEFNAKELIDKDFMKGLHPMVQEELDKAGIKATIITPERVAYNKYKEDLLKEYQKKIEEEPKKKEEFINEFWDLVQQHNPKIYKKLMKDKPKDYRLQEYNDMIEEFKAQQKTELEEEKKNISNQNEQDLNDFINDTNLKVASEKEAIKKDAKEQIEAEKKKCIEQIEIKKAELEAEKQRGMQALNDLEQEVKSIFDKYENDEKELQKYMQKDEKLQRIIDERKRNAPTKEDYEAVLELFENAYNAYAKQYNENVQLSISYNELVREYNDLNKNHQQEINSIRNHYEKMIDDLKKKYENFKNYIYGLLEKLGIHRPFNNNEKDEMIALKEQVDRSAVYYRKGVEQLEVPRTIQKTVTRSMNIDRTER